MENNFSKLVAKMDADAARGEKLDVLYRAEKLSRKLMAMQPQNAKWLEYKIAKIRLARANMLGLSGMKAQAFAAMNKNRAGWKKGLMPASKPASKQAGNFWNDSQSELLIWG